MTPHLLRKVSWAAAGAIVAASSRFAITALLARRLQKDGFGYFAYVQWISDLSFLILSFGASAKITRYFASEERFSNGFNSIIYYGFRAILIFPVVISVSVGTALWLLHITTDFTSVAKASFMSYGLAVWQIRNAALIGLQRFKYIFMLNIAWTLGCLLTIFSLPADVLTPGAVFCVIGLFSLVLSLFSIGELIPIRNSKREVSKSWSRQVRRYGYNMWITSILWNLAWARGEFPVVEAFLGLKAVAIYAAAFSIMGGGTQAIMLIVGGVLPALTKLVSDGEYEAARRLAKKVSVYQLLIAAFLALPIISFAPEIVTRVFGEGYVGASLPLATMSIGLLGLTFATQTHMLQVLTNGEFNRNCVLVVVCILYLSSLVLVNKFGLDGAAIARVLTLFSYGSLTWVWCRRRFGNGVYPSASLILSLLCLCLAILPLLSRPVVALSQRIFICLLLFVLALMGQAWLSFPHKFSLFKRN